MFLQIPDIIFDDWLSVQTAFDRVRFNLGTDATPTYAGLTLTGLTASRLLQADANKALSSVSDLTVWIAGTDNQVNVADDGDGTITLSTPQDIHVDAHPEFAGLTIKNEADDIIFYVDNDEMYFTVTAAIEIATGMPMGLLLALTYNLD
jgi:hypothetical protein